MNRVHGIQINPPTWAEKAEVWNTVTGFAKSKGSRNTGNVLHVDIGGPDSPESLCGHTESDNVEWVHKPTSVFPVGSKPLCKPCVEAFREGQYDG